MACFLIRIMSNIIVTMLQVKKILSENKTKTNSVLVSNLNKVNTFSEL